MNKKSLLLVFTTLPATAFLSACVSTPPIASLDCDPGTTTSITYGITGNDNNRKTTFVVKEKVRVKKGKALYFKLVPRGGKTRQVPDFEDAKVKIKGKAWNDTKDWFTLLEGSYKGTAGDRHRLGICANAEPDTYEYEIHIPGFGTLDPRVIVEPQ